jgi:hypothetical protein
MKKKTKAEFIRVKDNGWIKLKKVWSPKGQLIKQENIQTK